MFTTSIKPTFIWLSHIWLSHIWLPIIAVLVVAAIANFIGKKVIKIIIRRSVHGRHFGRKNQPKTDVKKRQDTIISITSVVWDVVIFIVTGFSLVTLLFPEINLVPFFASASIAGAIIGFGAQPLIRDLISGVFIITENQFRVGDVIEIEGAGILATGTVEHLTLRITVLRDVSGNVHYVSNGTILHATNKTMGYSKVNFSLSVHPDTDIDKLARIIDAVGEKLTEDKKWAAKIIEAPHFINLGAFSDTALEVNITGTTEPGEQWEVTSELKKRLLIELQRHEDVSLSQYIDLSALGKKK